jgi:hypothetical protein
MERLMRSFRPRHWLMLATTMMQPPEEGAWNVFINSVLKAVFLHLGWAR